MIKYLLMDWDWHSAGSLSVIVLISSFMIVLAIAWQTIRHSKDYIESLEMIPLDEKLSQKNIYGEEQ